MPKVHSRFRTLAAEITPIHQRQLKVLLYCNILISCISYLLQIIMGIVNNSSSLTVDETITSTGVGVSQNSAAAILFTLCVLLGKLILHFENYALTKCSAVKLFIY